MFSEVFCLVQHDWGSPSGVSASPLFEPLAVGQCGQCGSEGQKLTASALSEQLTAKIKVYMGEEIVYSATPTVATTYPAYSCSRDSR